VLARRLIRWALLADALPIYPLYALLFADAGLSAARISVLFAVWSVAAFVAAVPAGVLADRWSRRGCVVLAAVGQATAYATWVSRPSFAGFAAGFVLWGLSSALTSGAVEALLFDGLAAAGRADRFAGVYGRVNAAGLVGQLPAAAAAALLFPLGGYPLVGWVSVACCLGAAALAGRLPEPARGPVTVEAPDAEPGALRAGWRLVRSDPVVRAAVLLVAAVYGLDAAEEYFSLLARAWGVSTAAVPVVTLAIPLAGAAGAWWAGRRCHDVAAPLCVSAGLLLAAGLLARPLAVALVAAAYALYRAAAVAAQDRLQQRITGRARATVTSLASLAEEGPVLAVYAVWAAGGLAAFAALMLAVALSAWRFGRVRAGIMQG
jgi:MFS family permease